MGGCMELWDTTAKTGKSIRSRVLQRSTAAQKTGKREELTTALEFSTQCVEFTEAPPAISF